MIEEIIIAGFGGQGVMSMGQILTYAGMLDGKNVSWLPSYGPEQRGGTANCSVVISDEPVGSPVITQPTTAIVLNNPSFDKFEPKVCSGGCLIVNSSLIDRKSSRTDIKIIYVDATVKANELGNARVANSILLGVVLKNSKLLLMDKIIESLNKVLSPQLIPLNKRALEIGGDL